MGGSACEAWRDDFFEDMSRRGWFVTRVATLSAGTLVVAACSNDTVPTRVGFQLGGAAVALITAGSGEDNTDTIAIYRVEPTDIDAGAATFVRQPLPAPLRCRVSHPRSGCFRSVST